MSPRNSYRAEQASKVLASLGQHTPRPLWKLPNRGVVERLCRNPGCNVQIYVAPLASGQWAPLDRHPDGDLVIVEGVVRTRGPQNADAPAYIFHRCTQVGENHE